MGNVKGKGKISRSGVVYCGVCGEGEELNPLNPRQLDRWTLSKHLGAVHVGCLRRGRRRGELAQRRLGIPA